MQASREMPEALRPQNVVLLTVAPQNGDHGVASNLSSNLRSINQLMHLSQSINSQVTPTSSINSWGSNVAHALTQPRLRRNQSSAASTQLVPQVRIIRKASLLIYQSIFCSYMLPGKCQKHFDHGTLFL